MDITLIALIVASILMGFFLGKWRLSERKLKALDHQHEILHIQNIILEQEVSNRKQEAVMAIKDHQASIEKHRAFIEQCRSLFNS